MGDVKSLVDANIGLLEQGKQFLEEIPREIYVGEQQEYVDRLGPMMRHVLDMYKSLFRDYESRVIDLTQRERNEEEEVNPSLASQTIDDLLARLALLKGRSMSEPLAIVAEPIDNNYVKISTSLGSALNLLRTHTIHHYSAMRMVSKYQGYEVKVKGFGVEPSNRKNVHVNM